MTGDEKQQIAFRLKACREEAALTQEEVAERLGVRRQAVSKWEQGGAFPRAAEWYELGLLYGVSLDYMVYGIRTVPVSKYAIVEEVFRQRPIAKPPEKPPIAATRSL